MNESTHNSFNEMRFPISVGIFPEMRFEDKFLNNCEKIKVINMIFFCEIKLIFFISSFK